MKRASSLTLVVLVAVVATAGLAAASGGPPIGGYGGSTNQTGDFVTNRHGQVVLGVEAPLPSYKSGYKGCTDGCPGESVYLKGFTALPHDCNARLPPGQLYPPIVAERFASFRDGYVPVSGVVPIRVDGSFTLAHVTGSSQYGRIEASVTGRFTGERAAGTLTYGGISKRGLVQGHEETLACKGGTVTFVVALED